MGNITSTGSRRSGGSNSDVLAAAAEGRPQKRIKLTKTNDVNVGSPKYTSISSSNTHLQAVMVLIKLKIMMMIMNLLYQQSVTLWY